MSYLSLNTPLIIQIMLNLKEGESIDLNSLDKCEVLDIVKYAENILDLYDTDVHKFLIIMNRNDKLNKILNENN